MSVAPHLFRKAKGSFLYGKHEKFLDLSVGYSSYVFGYHHPVLKSKMKQFIGRALPVKIPSLVSHHGGTFLLGAFANSKRWLQNYEAFMLSPMQRQRLMLAWTSLGSGYALHRHAIDNDEAFEHVDIPLHQGEKAITPSKVLVYTDTFHVYNKPAEDVRTQDSACTMKVLWLNAFFPFLMDEEDLSWYDMILIGHMHPFGLSTASLGFVKQSLFKTKAEKASLSALSDRYHCAWSLAVYRAGVSYYLRKQEKASLKDLQANLKQALMHAKRKGWLHAFEGKDLHYRLEVNAEVIPSFDRLRTVDGMSNRFFVGGVSFLGDYPMIYIALSMTTPLEHFKNGLLRFFHNLILEASGRAD